ncbi:MAG: succinyldiaminopimelate transaminase [Microbacteriaceae bacterium]
MGRCPPTTGRLTTVLELPEFPWDKLVPFQKEAMQHPGGMIDLSVGSPIDPVPAMVSEALNGAIDAHGYPQTAGTTELRHAIIDWYARRRGVEGLTELNVMPSIGSKELVGTLALCLGIGPGDAIVQPELAYPTYAIGAAIVGAELITSDNPDDWPSNTKLVWLNSPGNPNGKVLSIAELTRAVARARELGAVIVNDECYIELGWNGEVPTILDKRVVGENWSDVLSVYSLSKQSNLAGYRAAFIAGCKGRVQQVLGVRKHLGMIPPAPVQAVMTRLLADDLHVQKQKEIYRSRRDILLRALSGAGFRVDESEAGLYLWSSADEDCWVSVSRFAKHGILVTPGDFYGSKGSRHIRVSLTAPDDQISSIEQRLNEKVIHA